MESFNAQIRSQKVIINDHNYYMSKKTELL